MSDTKQQGFEELFMERPESFEQLIDGMNSDVYESLKFAVEIGKWGDGVRLDAEQIDFCMQAIILYEAKRLPEQHRVGFDLSASCKSKAAGGPAQPISIVTSARAMNGNGVKEESEEGIKEGNKT